MFGVSSKPQQAIDYCLFSSYPFDVLSCCPSCLSTPSIKKKKSQLLTLPISRYITRIWFFLGRGSRCLGNKSGFWSYNFFYICLDTLYSLYRNEEHLKELTNRLYISLKVDKQTKTCSNRLVKYRMISIPILIH